MNFSIKKQETPLFIKLMYALGQMGWSLGAYGVANLLIYFYMPPQTGQEPVFMPYIYQGAVLGVATIIGLLSFSGRIFDAVTDPLVANWSDRAIVRFGRRRFFMAIGFLPFALFSALIFTPVTPGVSWLNVAWLFVCVLLLYFFMTIYVTPYTALISELGHTPNERLTISTFISVTFALGYGLGTQVFFFQHVLQTQYGLSAETAFKTVMSAFAILSALLMALPVIFVNEERYCISKPSYEPPLAAIRSVFGNRNFRYFAISDLMYWLALTFIQMGIAYYVTILLQLEAQYGSLVLMGMLGSSFVFYVPTNILARKWGKKRLMVFAFAAFTVIYLLMFFLGKYPLPPIMQIVTLGVLASIPIAIFSILPNAVVADIIESDAAVSGGHKAAIFFAVRSFMMKMGMSVANLLFPSLLLLGNSVQNPTGVRATAAAASVFCLLGWLLFSRYNEKEVLAAQA
ncbi:MFS transporter [Sphingobacteriales bacterium UPWRP_1]|nr:hypothetical protein B6N25_14385 [Sphingobacteriales bacterium TSM_CSS]PSJ78897.1 MFS transporter [Sphingobacteriales bacterium UPWRP_1]